MGLLWSYSYNPDGTIASANIGNEGLPLLLDKQKLMIEQGKTYNDAMNSIFGSDITKAKDVSGNLSKLLNKDSYYQAQIDRAKSYNPIGANQSYSVVEVPGADPKNPPKGAFVNPATGKVEQLNINTYTGGGGGGILGTVGAIVGVALAPATGGASLALAAPFVKDNFVTIRNAVETAAVLAGNYYVPGSSAITSNLASKGSQAQLNSPLGKVAQIASSIAGGIPSSPGSSAAADAASSSAGTAASTIPTSASLTDQIIASNAANAAGVSAPSAAAGASITDAAISSATAPAAATAATTTGGFFVGTNGLIAGTSNPIIDGALNSALSNGTTNAAMAAATGGNSADAFGKGALSGAVTGGIGAAVKPVVAQGVADIGITGTAANSLTNGVTGALKGAGGAAVAGGNVLNGAISGGVNGAATPIVAKYVSDIGLTGSAANSLTNGVTGAIGASTDAALNGGNIGNAAIVGGLAGAAGGYVNGLVGGGLGGQIAGQIASGVVSGIASNSLPIYSTQTKPASTVVPGAPSSVPPPVTGVDTYGSIINQNGIGSAIPANYMTGGSKASQVAMQKYNTGLLGA